MPENLSKDDQEKLKEMIDTWETAHRAIKFLCAMGNILKWTLGVLAPLAIIWSALHGGKPS
jgi:hypothetical protein